MNELTLDGKVYVSSKRAAEMTGYAKDYVGQLCREGRVEARLVGRNWYILKSAIEKHRFAAEAEPAKEAVETPRAKHSPAVAWERPKYKLDEPMDLPSINKLADEPLEQAEVPQTTVEAMQDAWHSWFNRSEEIQEPEIVAEDSEMSQEPVEDAVSDEVAVPLHYVARTNEQHEALNLRRIREYQPESEAAEAIIVSEIVRPNKRAKKRGGSYTVLQAVFIFLAIIAVGVGYIGAGFLNQGIISYQPARFIAGVSVYDSSR